MDIVELVIYVLEIAGTIAFAISGVIIAIDKELDFFGAIVLGGITAVGGGALRDVLLGITPPVMFQNYIFVMTAGITSFIVFIIEYTRGELLNKKRQSYMRIINIFDTVGLGVFVVVGVNIAILNGHSNNWFLVVFIGTITGVGGGVFRDLLAGQIPMILHKQVYAVAAIAGATLNFILYSLELNSTLTMIVSAMAVMVIRFVASYYDWNLPKVKLNRLSNVVKSEESKQWNVD